ncbi:12208_t:CDS:2, partial [Dentiscutata heterogama]
SKLQNEGAYVYKNKLLECPEQNENMNSLDYLKNFQELQEYARLLLDLMNEMYKAGDESKRKASQQLLNTIHTSLTEITINAPDSETLLFFKTASKLYREKLSPQKFNFSDK